MLNADKAFVQAYNGQIAVDAGEHQLIVGCLWTNQAADTPQLAPMLDQIATTLGRVLTAYSADSGYFSAANVAAVEAVAATAYIPPDRERHGTTGVPLWVTRILSAAGLAEALADQAVAADARPSTATPAKLARRMRSRSPAGRAAYALRKPTVEPVFGQFKAGRGLRQFLVRGLTKVRAEWTLWCLTHNLRKLVQALTRTPHLRAQLALG